jgi:hypothetical protein
MSADAVEGTLMMSACEQYEEALWDAAESGCISDALQRHCQSCRECRAALPEMTRIVTGLTALHALPTPVPRPDLARHLPRHRRPLAWVVGLAAAAACGLALLWLPRHTRHEVTQHPTPPAQTSHPAPTRVAGPPAAPRPLPLGVPTPALAATPIPRTDAGPRVRRTSLKPTMRFPTPLKRATPPAPPSPPPPPALVAIHGTATPPLPAGASTLEADRILLLSEEPEFANQIYQAIETIGPGDLGDYQLIYETPAGG